MIYPELAERLKAYKAVVRVARSEARASFYVAGAVIVGSITFVACWIYCIVTYGFLLGVGLGWLPSMITAFILGAVWPLVVVAAIVGVAVVVR